MLNASMANVAVYLNIMEIHTLTVDQNAFLVQTVISPSLVSMENVWILALVHADKTHYVK